MSSELWELWGVALFVGGVLAMLAGIMSRKRQAHRLPRPREFEGAIEAIRSEINKKVTIMGDAVIALLKENRSRFENLQNHTEQLDGRVNEQGHYVRSVGGAIRENSEMIHQINDEVRELSAGFAVTIERFSQFQNNLDQRFSEDSEIKRVSVEALAGRIDTLSEQVIAAAKDYADFGGSLNLLAQSVAALTADAAHIKDSTHELEKHVVSIQSSLADLTQRLKSAESSIGELGRVSNGQFQSGQSIFRIVRPS